MISLSKGINRLRKISLYLFLFPSLALIISLIAHNLLVSFNLSLQNIDYKNKLPIIIKCTKENNFCLTTPKNITKNHPEYFANITQFNQCEKYIVSIDVLIENEKINFPDYINKYSNEAIYSKDQLSKLDIKKVYSRSNKIDNGCIKNSNLKKIYKIIPQFIYFLVKIKSNEKYAAGTSEAINPFIYGETSISNIAKRYPVNLVFKPLLFIGSFLMILYWVNYHNIFKQISYSQKINKFTFFGIFSSILLFFHVLFLGTEIDNEIFTKIRRLILILFILFEILAQYFLTRRLYQSLNKVDSLIYSNILNLKIIFVSIIIISSIIILAILSFSNLDSKIDYILEWNYFLFLMVFYLLSAILWRKQTI